MAMIKNIFLMVVAAVLFFGTISVAHQHGKGQAHSAAVSQMRLTYEIEDGIIHVTFDGQPVSSCDTTIQAYLIGDEGFIADLGVITVVKEIAVEHYNGTNETFSWYLPAVAGEFVLKIYIDNSCGLLGSDSVSPPGIKVRI